MPTKCKGGPEKQAGAQRRNGGSVGVLEPRPPADGVPAPRAGATNAGGARTGRKRSSEAAGLDGAPAKKLHAPVHAHQKQGNGIKRCKTSGSALQGVCKVKIASILEEFGSLGLEINPGPSTASAAQRESPHAASKEDKKAHKRAPPAKQICCYCATVRTAPADCTAGIDFCCRDSVGKHACMIKCIWTGCKRPIPGSIITSMDRFRSGVAAHAKECSCKQPTLSGVAQRLINLSIRLPFSAVHDADEQMWVQFAEDCLNCRAPEGMGVLIRRLYDQIKPTTLHPAWVASESTHFVRETFRVKTASNAALLVLRIEFGAVHWGRVDRCFRVERAAESLVGLRQTIEQRMRSDEALRGKAAASVGKITEYHGPAAKTGLKGVGSMGEEKIACIKLTATPAVTPTPNAAATPTNSKLTPISAPTARGRGAFALSDAHIPPSKPSSTEDRSSELAGPDWRPDEEENHTTRTVYQLSVGSHQLVQCHPSIADAATAAGVGKSQMHKALRLQSTLKGCLWQYTSADGSSSRLPIPSIACGSAIQGSHEAFVGDGTLSACGRAAGGTEGMLGGAQDWHKVQLDHQSKNSSKDAPPKLPKRNQCGLCGKSDGHNRKTCPQLRNLCGKTLLSGSEPTVQELPRSEPPTRKSTPTLFGFLGFRSSGSRDGCVL